MAEQYKNLQALVVPQNENFALDTSITREEAVESIDLKIPKTNPTLSQSRREELLKKYLRIRKFPHEYVRPFVPSSN